MARVLKFGVMDPTTTVPSKRVSRKELVSTSGLMGANIVVRGPMMK